jgi:hypothetical protein
MKKPKPRHIPRTAAQAAAGDHRKLSKKQAKALLHEKGAHLSPNGAKPGDIAWVGPCESTGTRVICYYDRNMDPSDCRNVPC